MEKVFAFSFHQFICKKGNCNISLMRDQTIQVNEHGIKVAYMGLAAKSQPATTEALKSTSDMQIIFVTAKYLFTKQLDNVSKLKMLEEADQLSLIALDEAHLICEWNSFWSTVYRVSRFSFIVS